MFVAIFVVIRPAVEVLPEHCSASLSEIAIFVQYLFICEFVYVCICIFVYFRQYLLWSGQRLKCSAPPSDIAHQLKCNLYAGNIIGKSIQNILRIYALKVWRKFWRGQVEREGLTHKNAWNFRQCSLCWGYIWPWNTDKTCHNKHKRQCMPKNVQYVFPPKGAFKTFLKCYPFWRVGASSAAVEYLWIKIKSLADIHENTMKIKAKKIWEKYAWKL